MNVPYQVKVYLRNPIAAPKELKAVHPLGKFSLADSYWSHYAEGSLMLFMQMALVFVISGQQAPWYVKPVISGFVNTVKMESELGKTAHGWFSGTSEPGAGDFMMCYPLNVLINTGRMPEIEVGPNLRKWMAAVEARPAFQRGKQRLEEEERKAKDAAGEVVSIHVVGNSRWDRMGKGRCGGGE
ncbi:hypothetical protein QFC19_003915 [Naganishia cerealis]|uniref:Uncharacterized protein n=1 Tax=Naganishia cerealis TaxID=610337 RepID=A0ACC2W0L9_9TREE|nr:hypothetical protein QFC19_003915 [Naganishia cerealis]